MLTTLLIFFIPMVEGPTQVITSQWYSPTECYAMMDGLIEAYYTDAISQERKDYLREKSQCLELIEVEEFEMDAPPKNPNY